MRINCALPMGGEEVATVPLLNLWTVWWNADRAAAGFQHYWDAPIFHPTPTTFVFSEAQPTTVIVAPLAWLTERPVVAYNVYLLAALMLNGGLTYHLLRGCGITFWPAVAGGVMTQILPFVCWQLGVLQLVQLWPVIWTLGAMVRWTQQPRWRTAVEIGVAFGVAYAACNYYGLFSAVLLAPAGLWLLRRAHLTIRSGMQFCLAGIVAASLMWPIVSVQRRTSAEHGWSRDDALVVSLSAHLRDYTDTPWRQWLDAWEVPADMRSDIWVLGPGWLKLLVGGAGAVLGLVFSGRRRWTLFVLTFGGFALAYSLGPNGELWNVSLYRGLRDHVPGFSHIRSPFRFAVFVQLAVVWLSVECLQRLHPQQWWPRLAVNCGRWERALAWVAWVPMLLLGGGLIAETLPPVQKLHAVAGPTDLPLWVTFLRDETPPDSPVICLPVSLGATVYDYESEAEWMAWGIWHERPLLNGYSGYFPDSYVTLNEELDHFPEQGAQRVQELGARYAVVDRSVSTERQLARHPATKHWEWLLSDGPGGMDIYRIPPEAPEASSDH